MQPRVDFQQLYKAQPALSRSLRALNDAAREAGLELSLIHLVKLRVSQINGWNRIAVAFRFMPNLD